MGGGLRGNLRWSTQKVSTERETGCLCKSSPNVISAITETCIANNPVMFGFYHHRLCQVFKCCESFTLVCLLLVHPGFFLGGGVRFNLLLQTRRKHPNGCNDSGWHFSVSSRCGHKLQCVVIISCSLKNKEHAVHVHAAAGAC